MSQYNLSKYEQIQVSNRPAHIDIEEITFNASQCIANAYKVAEKNNGTKFIEGVIIHVGHNNGGHAMAHAWNKVGNIYFDVTAEQVWTTFEAKHETKEVRYVLVKEHEIVSLGEAFQFSEECLGVAKQINDVLVGRGLSSDSL